MASPSEVLLRAARVLVIPANPMDTARLAIGEECRVIDQRAQAARAGAIDLRFAPEMRADELAQALQRHRPDAVHFSGHGTESGELLLVGADGSAVPVPTEAIAEVFRALARDVAVRCVVLNACYSEALARALTEHVACVVGVSSALADRASLAYASAFYEALAFGRDLATAHALGVASIHVAAPEQSTLPELHHRQDVRPDALRLVDPVSVTPPTTVEAAKYPQAPCTVPSRSEVPFVGRTEELASLDAWCASEVQVMVLHGAPGVGKSRVASEWARRQAGRFASGVWWVPGDSSGRVLAELARTRGTPRAADDTQDAWGWRALKDLGDEDALLIFDDVADDTAAEALVADVTRARVLLVSRASYWPAGYGQQPMGPLPDADALALVRRILRDPATAERYASTLVERAAGNAVELVVTAASIDRDIARGRRVREPSDLATETRGSFARAWEATLPDARVALCAASIFAPDVHRERIARLLAAVGWDDDRALDAIADAEGQHMLVRGEDGLDVPKLLRVFAHTMAPTTLPKEVVSRAWSELLDDALEMVERGRPGGVVWEGLYLQDVALWRSLGIEPRWEEAALLGAAPMFDAITGSGPAWLALAKDAKDGKDSPLRDALVSWLLAQRLCVYLDEMGDGPLPEELGETGTPYWKSVGSDALAGRILTAVGFGAVAGLRAIEQWIEAREVAVAVARSLERGAAPNEPDLIGRAWTEQAYAILGMQQDDAYAEALEALADAEQDVSALLTRAVGVLRRGDAGGRVDGTALGDALAMLARVEGADNGDDAVARFREAIEVFGRGDYDGVVDYATIAGLWYELAGLHFAHERLDDARASYASAVETLGRCGRDASIENAGDLARYFTGLNLCHTLLGHDAEALAAATSAVAAARDFRKAESWRRNDPDDRGLLAQALCSLGSQLVESDPDAAVRTLAEAVADARIDAPDDELAYDPLLLLACLRDQATVFVQVKRAADGEAPAAEAIKLARAAVREDDSARQELVDALNVLADVREALGRAKDATPLRREAEKLAKAIEHDAAT